MHIIKKVFGVFRDFICIIMASVILVAIVAALVLAQKPFSGTYKINEIFNITYNINRTQTYVDVAYNSSGTAIYNFNLLQLFILCVIFTSLILSVFLMIVYILNFISLIKRKVNNHQNKVFYEANFPGEENLPDYGAVIATILYNDHWGNGMGFDTIGIIKERIFKYYRKDAQTDEEVIDNRLYGELEQKFIDICKFERGLGKKVKDYLENMNELAEMKNRLDNEIAYRLRKMGYIVAHKNSNLSLSYFVLTKEGKKESIRVKHLSKILKSKNYDDLKEQEKLFLNIIARN